MGDTIQKISIVISKGSLDGIDPGCVSQWRGTAAHAVKPVRRGAPASPTETGQMCPCRMPPNLCRSTRGT
jgi:hypothetical protein